MNVKILLKKKLGLDMKKFVLSVWFGLWSGCAAAQTPVLSPDLTSDSAGGIVISPEDMNFDDTVSALIEDETPQNGGVKVDTKRSLTENLKDNAPAQAEDPAAGGNKNWVGELISTIQTDDGEGAAKNKSNPLASVIDGAENLNKRSNASIFDVSGVMLRMSYPQAEAALLKRGYKKTMQKLDIPNFIRWRYEEKCRNQGVIGYERLNGCVIKLSRENKFEYVAQAQFNKYDTQETVQFFLTSTFTNNKVYKVTYRSEAANNAGNSAKAIYLRNIKVYDFWKKINQKYGVPDNKQEVTWSLGANKPYLKAATGFLVLEDPMLRELDYTRMSREDQRFMNTDLYTF